MTTGTHLIYSYYSAQKQPINQDEMQYRAIPDWERYKDITEIRLGNAVYPLREESIKAIPVPSGDIVEFYAVDFPEIKGLGSTPDEARKNWRYEFHTRFQDIYAKRDLGLSESERELLNRFIDIIDIEKHLAETPLSFQQTGKIVANDDLPSHRREIKWLDDTHNVVDCAECPPELQQYKAGQYFRANILREYGTGKLLEICSISPTKYRDYSDKELGEFVDSLQTSKKLPISNIWK